MTWRNCIASIKLNDEIKKRYPKREWSSDGTIGDAAHAARNSDHNPWLKDRNGVGVVRARDIDEDLDGNPADSGHDAAPLFNHLLGLAKAGDPRINGGGYLIYEAKIYSATGNWVARPYTGTANPHKKHIHLSFSRNPAGYDSDKPWGLLTPTQAKPNVIKSGDRGNQVAFMVDMGNILAGGGALLGGNWKAKNFQINVPKDKAGRDRFLFDQKVKDQVMGIQRFGQSMWKLAGSKGKKPAIDGVFGPETAGIYAFWVPLALQK